MKQEPEDLQTAASHRGADHADYRETDDITRVHAAVQREHGDPTTGAVPVPLWLMALGGVAIFWGAAYLGMFSGGFRGDIFNERDSSPKLLFPDKMADTGGGGGPAAAEDPIAQGKKAFAANCVSCHQANGMGIPGQYPPLVKSAEYVTAGNKRPIMILLKGIQGKLKVGGVEYNGAMPPWQALNDKKIAQILTYIRQDWGNTAPPITPEQVAAGRKEFAAHTESFTEAELLAVPADANYESGAPAAPTPEAAK